MLSKTALLRNLSSCPRTGVPLIAVSVHSELLTISPSPQQNTYYPFVLGSSRPPAQWLQHSCATWTMHSSFPPAPPPQISSPCLSPSHDRAPSVRFITFALICFPSDRLRGTASSDLWQRDGNSTHFYPGSRQQQWQMGLLFCLTLGVLRRERGFISPDLCIWNTLCKLSSLLLFKICIWPCLLLPWNAVSFAQMDGSFWLEINLLSWYAGIFNFFFFFNLTAKYKCSVVYGCIQLC